MTKRFFIIGSVICQVMLILQFVLTCTNEQCTIRLGMCIKKANRLNIDLMLTLRYKPLVSKDQHQGNTGYMNLHRDPLG